MADLDGGCLCGAIRYRVTGAPIDAGYCHCRICQRSTGAPVVAWGTWPTGSLAWLTTEPAAFSSSARGVRGFCASCGTHLTFRTVGRSDLDVTLASLDDPERFTPEYHIWTGSRIGWLRLGDALPRHEGDEPRD